MPIDITAIREAANPPDERIAKLLADHSTQAYALFELIAELEGHRSDLLAAYGAMLFEKAMFGQSLTLEKYQAAVDRLRAAGRLKEIDIGKVKYFANPDQVQK